MCLFVVNIDIHALSRTLQAKGFPLSRPSPATNVPGYLRFTLPNPYIDARRKPHEQNLLVLLPPRRNAHSSSEKSNSHGPRMPLSSYRNSSLWIKFSASDKLIPSGALCISIPATGGCEHLTVILVLRFTNSC